MAKKDATKKKKTLVIVESPAKAKTINRYLGDDYVVEASMGHVIDLPKSRMAVDIENSFTPDYITVRGRGKILNNIKRLAGKSCAVMLAADEDREGEAISYHLGNQIKKKYPDMPISRIVFHEITKKAIQEAIKTPGEITEAKVNAQKARRVLDRIVGYSISPILWEKVKKGLSAGRVQSVSLRIICEREDAIHRFEPQEYWDIDISLKQGKQSFNARLARIDGEKAVIPDQESVDRILSELETGSYICKAVEVKSRIRRPTAPFTTSKMQQAAATKLGFTSAKTMRIAQQLYEGIELPDGPTGFISYMRTDSTRISDYALDQVRGHIKSEYGEEFLPETSNSFKNKKGAQDAHEAIRPTDVSRTPDAVKQYLTRDQFRLYKLIWSKFVSSQMKPAQFEQTVLSIENGKYLFRANGSRVLFKGFLKVYGDMEDEEKYKKLPAVKEGAQLETSDDPEATQHFTQPPPRFTDASIVKILEESGIGRPSTYAPTISTLIKRYYVTRKGRQLIPSELGQLINGILVKHFSELVNINFTADMEERLDRVEEESLNWVSLLEDFYKDFKPAVEMAAENIENMKNIFDEETDHVCKDCGKPMVKKLGRFGYFLACSGFPDCRNTQPIPLAKCPEKDCGGSIVAKKGKKRGRLFYGCTNYKDDGTGCSFVSWDKPVEQPCPSCGGLLVEKNTKEDGYILVCIREDCGHKEKMES